MYCGGGWLIVFYVWQGFGLIYYFADKLLLGVTREEGNNGQVGNGCLLYSTAGVDSECYDVLATLF